MEAHKRIHPGRISRLQHYQPWFDAIRSMPGLLVEGSPGRPLLGYSALNAFRDMLTDTSAVSPFDRSLTVAARIKIILNTAMDLVENAPNNKFSTVEQLLERTVEELSFTGAMLKGDISPQSASKIISILVKARLAFLSSSQSINQPVKGIQSFLDTLDKWCFVKDKHQIRSQPNDETREQGAVYPPTRKGGGVEIQADPAPGLKQGGSALPQNWPRDRESTHNAMSDDTNSDLRRDPSADRQPRGEYWESLYHQVAEKRRDLRAVCQSLSDECKEYQVWHQKDRAKMDGLRAQLQQNDVLIQKQKAEIRLWRSTNEEAVAENEYMRGRIEQLEAELQRNNANM